MISASVYCHTSGVAFCRIDYVLTVALTILCLLRMRGLVFLAILAFKPITDTVANKHDIN